MIIKLAHDDVIKWKHFPRNWPFVRVIHRSPVNSPHKGQWRGTLMFSLIYVWINDWVNNREAGDLRRYRAHSDVIVMDQEHITTVKNRVVGFLVVTYFRVTMNIRIPHAIKIWSCLFTFKNILKLRRSSSFSWSIFSIEMEQQMYVIYSRGEPLLYHV